MLTGLAGALSVLGLSSLENTMDQIVNLSGRALVALVILIAGVLSAGWLAELVAREAENAGLRGPNVFRRVVFITVVAIRAARRGAARPRDIRAHTARHSRPRHRSACSPWLSARARPPLQQRAAGRYVQDGTQVGDVISVDGVEGTVEELGYAL